MSASLVGSEMCIRDRPVPSPPRPRGLEAPCVGHLGGSAGPAVAGALPRPAAPHLHAFGTSG
eukprot:11948860-Alexandrium_andersonii.AAC.1